MKAQTILCISTVLSESILLMKYETCVSMQVLHVYLFLVPEIRKKNFLLLGVGRGGGGGTGATSTSAMGKVLV